MDREIPYFRGGRGELLQSQGNSQYLIFNNKKKKKKNEEKVLKGGKLTK